MIMLVTTTTNDDGQFYPQDNVRRCRYFFVDKNQKTKQKFIFFINF